MLSFSLRSPTQQIPAMHTATALRAWARRRAERAALERLDDHMRRDVGWPTQRQAPIPRHEAAAHIAMMAWR